MGSLFGNAISGEYRSKFDHGISFSKSTILKTGIVIYGFQVSLQDIWVVGWSGFFINVIIISATLLLAVYIGRHFLAMDLPTTLLIGAGSAICGAAAILATAPVVRGKDREVSVAVAMIVLFGTASMVLYPLAYPYMNMSDAAYGVYVGSTVHEMAQVVGAGFAVSEEAATIAVIQKMMRVVLLTPSILILGFFIREGNSEGAAGKYPWFILFFVIVIIINSITSIPEDLKEAMKYLGVFMLAMAMSALGMHTKLSDFRAVGSKPLILAGSLFLFLAVGGYGVNRVIVYTAFHQ